MDGGIVGRFAGRSGDYHPYSAKRRIRLYWKRVTRAKNRSEIKEQEAEITLGRKRKTMKNVVLISEEEYRDYEGMGFCTVCMDWTSESIEPDAENCYCEYCNNNSVVGTPNALIMGLIDIG